MHTGHWARCCPCIASACGRASLRYVGRAKFVCAVSLLTPRRRRCALRALRATPTSDTFPGRGGGTCRPDSREPCPPRSPHTCTSPPTTAADAPD
eukprot:scaffold15795_cov110-Isochrysis_galbana.AAC.2